MPVNLASAQMLPIDKGAFKAWLKRPNPNSVVGKCNYQFWPLLPYLKWTNDALGDKQIEIYKLEDGDGRYYLVAKTWTRGGEDPIDGQPMWGYIPEHFLLPDWASWFVEGLSAYLEQNTELSVAQSLRALEPFPARTKYIPPSECLTYKAILAASPVPGTPREAWRTLVANVVEILLQEEMPLWGDSGNDGQMPKSISGLDFLGAAELYEIRKNWPFWRRLLPLRAVALLEPAHEREFWNRKDSLWNPGPS